MKTYLMLLVVLTVNAWEGATNEVPSGAEQERIFMEAVLLRQHGLYGEAEAKLKDLATWQPNQPTIKEMLTDVQAKMKAKEAEPVSVLKRRLAEIVFPVVNFREAAALDVIQYFQTESGKLAADKTEINFVWLVPAEAKLGAVTLSLKKVPLADALDYVTQLAGLKYRVEAHAVVIYQPEVRNAKSE